MMGRGFVYWVWYVVALTFFACAIVLGCGCDPDILNIDERPIAEVPTALPATKGARVVWLAWADGEPLTRVGADPCARWTPPRASASADQRDAVEAQVNAWFAPFGITFTYVRPAAVDSMVVVTDSNDWCMTAPNIGGIAPFSGRPISGTAYAFVGTWGVNELAQTIAQEYAHMLGLEHSTLDGDAMYPVLAGDCQGFLDQDAPVGLPDLVYRGHQNSHAMLLAALGPR